MVGCGGCMAIEVPSSIFSRYVLLYSGRHDESTMSSGPIETTSRMRDQQDHKHTAHSARLVTGSMRSGTQAEDSYGKVACPLPAELCPTTLCLPPQSRTTRARPPVRSLSISTARNQALHMIRHQTLLPSKWCLAKAFGYPSPQYIIPRDGKDATTKGVPVSKGEHNAS